MIEIGLKAKVRDRIDGDDAHQQEVRMPTAKLQIISENKGIFTEGDTFEAALDVFEQKLRLKLTFGGDGESPYIMDEVPTNQRSAASIEPSRHVYVR